jgi:probable rRNA maturation factor
MSSRLKRSKALDVTVQFATRRTGVPHASSLARWANLAFGAAQSRKPAAMPLTIRIVGAAESRVLNRTWRGKDKPTNVLSFPGMCPGLGAWGSGQKGKKKLSSLAQAPSPKPQLFEFGDLAICAPIVAREARAQGKDPRAHWAHMVVHGVLHLLGYDHENDRDADDMESREVKILAQFGYADPYG